MLVALSLRQSLFVNVCPAARLALYDCDYPTNDRQFIVQGSPDSSRLARITHYPLGGRATGYCMCRDLHLCCDDEQSKSQIKQRNKQIKKNLLDDTSALFKWYLLTLLAHRNNGAITFPVWALSWVHLSTKKEFDATEAQRSGAALQLKWLKCCCYLF